jgi:UDP-N-acetylmuramoyl-L-alanyl-D-glutamate--2,6-diaminopimelate ligase
MELTTLAGALDEPKLLGAGDVVIRSIDYDSRQVVEGSLFCCIVGADHDGHDFAPVAVDRGAAALLVERPLDLPIAQLVVADTRVAMALAAAAFHDHPSAAMTVIGVTGTNGKTTTVQLLANVLREAGWRVETLGTLTGARTTPEAPDLQATLARWRDDGVQAVAMEVSSHALALHRVDGTRFAVSVFTNLSRDHLDFHGTMEAYFETKALLFQPTFTDRAVVNRDSPYGRLLDDSAAVPTQTYGLDDLDAIDVHADRSSFTWHGRSVELPLGGEFNLSNALAAAEAARAVGVDDAAIVAGLASPVIAPGRFEVIDSPLPFSVIVDYAHTPDALQKVLEAAAGIAGEAQVTVVFGAGGDRDATKRPAMGEVAARLADRVVLTADNSRGEDTGAIIDAVRQGFDRVTPRHATDLVIEPDRRKAIAAALAAARPGDVVLVAGKGHEQTLTVGDVVVPFDDRDVARDELTKLAEASA